MTGLLAGWASTALPTAPDESLLGYDFRQERLAPGNAGEHDPLHVRAIALRDGAAAALVICLDHCVVSRTLAQRLRESAARAADLPASAVIVACTHTHSAPLAHDPDLGRDLATALPHVETSGGEPERRVTARLLTATADAAARAAGLLVPVEAAAACTPCGLAYRRRVADPAGVRLCWNPEEQADLALQPGEDPTLSVLHLRRLAGGRSALLFSLGAHPVCLGKTSRTVSADWPGAACAAIVRHAPGCFPAFALGACGDTHPWIATQDDPAALAILGEAAGGLALALARSARASAGLRCASHRITIGACELDLSAVGVGGAVLLAAPVELFQSLSARLRSKIAQPVLLLTNANGWTGYWPGEEDFPRGGYEVEAALAHGRKPGDGEALVAALADLARTVTTA